MPAPTPTGPGGRVPGKGKATATLSWESKQLEALATKAMVAGLREAGKFARAGIKATLRSSGPSAEGSPPGKVSGDLARAISYRAKTKKGRFTALDVGVLRPNPRDRKYPGEMYAKALRLARGFVGRDRLGRTYSQRGRPFVDPFINANRERLADIVTSTASSWMPKAKKKG